MIEFYIVKNGIDTLVDTFDSIEQANLYIKSCELSPRRKQMAIKEGRRIYNKRSPLFDCERHYLKDTQEVLTSNTAIVSLGSSLSGNNSVQFHKGEAVIVRTSNGLVLTQYQQNSCFARSDSVLLMADIEPINFEKTLNINITKVYPVKEVLDKYIQNLEFKVIEEISNNIVKEVQEEKVINNKNYEINSTKKYKVFITLGIKILDNISIFINKIKNRLVNSLDV